MGEVLMRDEKPRDIWDQHEDLLQSVVDGDPEGAEQKARQHIMETANFIIDRLSSL
jgi:DNA-binding GntR family transcriptional regulator